MNTPVLEIDWSVNMSARRVFSLCGWVAGTSSQSDPDLTGFFPEFPARDPIFF
jgi:hypothetical protein